ncbi:hypothetical protein BC830DRAFT_1119129 [Chytriomyces sp. MP71]|nr:hypothetical protein BC830DRAFT_1119129 [Chytriomyces sp. MP71]
MCKLVHQRIVIMLFSFAGKSQGCACAFLKRKRNLVVGQLSSLRRCLPLVLKSRILPNESRMTRRKRLMAS